MSAQLQFIEQTHQYFLDDKLIPSVTQVLGLANLYEFIDKRLLDKAARFGTAVHKMTELYDAGQLNIETLDVALIPYLEGWKKFLAETQFKVIAAEEKVYSSFGYAGTLDRIGIFDEKLTLLDIKTGVTIAKTTCLQLAAYKQAWKELHEQNVEQLICVQLKPHNYSLVKYENPTDFLTFMQFLNVYKWSHDYD